MQGNADTDALCEVEACDLTATPCDCGCAHCLEHPHCSFGCNGERWVVQDDHDPKAWWPGSNGPTDEQVPCPGCNADGQVPQYDGGDA